MTRRLPPEVVVLWDVASYRLRRLEMANLAAACAIMIALRLSAIEIVVRAIFGALLNLFVYLNNDYFDREDDAEASGREHDKTGFLREHAGAALRAQIGLLALLGLYAFVWGGGLWRPLVLGGGICVVYSAVLKRRPFVDVMAMIVWGFAMPWVGVPPDHAAAVPLLVQLALVSGVFESIQVMRDHGDDLRRGVRTTAVVLGLPLTRRLARLLALLAALWAGAAFHPGFAIPGLFAAALPMDETDATRTWNRVRLLFGLTLLAECGWIWVRGAA